MPNLVNPEEFVQNPDRTYKKALMEATLIHPSMILVKPRNYNRVSVGLEEEFLKEHPVYPIGGFRRLMRLFRMPYS